MIKLYTIGSEYESAKRLGFSVDKSLEEVFACDHDNDVVVRWGNSAQVYRDRDYQKIAEFKNVINLSKNISNNCYKHKALEKLARVVTTPKMFNGKVPKDVHAVIRPIHHASGNGFQVVKGPHKYETYDFYATEFLKTEEEYRVWFCGDATFYAKRVALNGEDVDNEFPCRSNWGYSYRDKIPESLRIDTLKAAETLGLEFGAADVLKYKGKFYFLELNSAPSIDTNTLIRFFQNNLKALIAKKFPNLI